MLLNKYMLELKNMKVKKGDKIKIDYTGTFDDGKEFDSSTKHGAPLEFDVGSGQVIKGFDDAVVGMQKGEEKKIKVAPQEAYGDHNPQLIKKVPREVIPANIELKKDLTLGVATPDGLRLPVTIKDFDDKEITLDLNHPLAGKTLNFNLKLVDIVGSTSSAKK
jgi:FKBP-type peptidyl-prolyl cis-trans isomerase 2